MSTQLPSLAEPTTEVPVEAATSSTRESRIRQILVIGLILLGLACLVVKLINPFESLDGDSAGWLMQRVLPRIQRIVSGWSLTAMIVYPFALLGILLLERWRPAVANQRTFGSGLLNDSLWMVFEATVVVVLVGWYSRILFTLYDHYLRFLTPPLAKTLPPLVLLAIGAIVLDLTRWGQHWLHHHVKWLWPFHAVHHAQRELNVFSDHRIHLMEYVVRRPVSVLPMLMLGLEAPEVTWWLLLLAWHSRLYHANIKSDFGALRYIFVTPQSHRVHHSRNPEHFDHNYGAMLSIWDYLFGTQYRRYDIYPETGIDDDTFSTESAGSVAGAFGNVARQMAYPFKRLWLGHG